MVIDEAEREIKNSPQPRLKLELALLKLASLDRTADLRLLLQKLERLEGMIERGETPPSAPSPKPAPARTTQTAEPTTPAYASPPERAAPVVPPDAGLAARPPHRDGRRLHRGPTFAGNRTAGFRLRHLAEPESAAPEPEAADESERDDPGPPPARPAPRPAASPAPAAPKQPEPDLRIGLFGSPALQRKRTPDGDPSAALGDGASGRAEAVSVVATDAHFGVSLHRVREVWPRLIDTVKAERPSVAGVLAHVEPVAVEHGTVQVAVPSAFVQQLLRSEQASFTEALADAMGEEPPPLAFVVRDGAVGETATPPDRFERIKQLRHEHPVIRAIFEQFGGEIVWT